MEHSITYTAFAGFHQIASGPLEETLRAILDREQQEDALLIFEDQTGKQVDFDMRGSIEEILNRVAPKPERTGPGRPKLGVTSREVSLLPRHWEWLETQANGASATLRRLIDDRRKQDGGESEVRAKIEAVGRVMSAIGGNLPGFEEAYRSLYARDREKLAERIKEWPRDLRDYVLAGFAS